MSHEAQIHEAQTRILRELLFLPHCKFAKLQKVSKLDSDHAKFHIKRLVELGYVDKIDNKILKEQIDFFSEIRHAYHEFNMVEEAIYQV